MAVSFNAIPSTLRVPFVTAEFDNSRAQQGPALLAYRALFIGQASKASAAVANSLVRVTSASQVASLAGRGSMLHRQAIAFFADNKFTETYMGVLADPSGAIATGTITVTGPATEDGEIALYLGGERVTVAVTNADTASTIATNIAAAIGKHASATVTFTSAGSGDHVTVNGTQFAATAGAVTLGDATYSYATGDAETATSFAAQINAHATIGKLVRATAASNVVTLRAIAGGTAANAYTLTAVDGTATAVSGATFAGGTAETDLAVHASVSSAVVTVHYRHPGAVGNEFDVRDSYNEGEVLPNGVTLAYVALSGGGSNPSLTSLISAMGDTWFHIVANPYTDSTSLTSLETEFASRFGPLRMIDGQIFSAKSASLGSLATLGNSRNSPHSSITATNSSPTPPAEYAANVAGTTAFYANIDPARPLQTLPLSHVKAPSELDQFTIEERNSLLYDGISTTKVASGGVVQIERLITTYQTNGAGAPDTSYLDVTTMLTLLYLRYSFRTRIASRYPRHKLASDSARFGAGQAIITPKIGKAEAIAWFREMEELGLVENFDQFKTDLVVERNLSDPNRLDFLLPPDLINQFICGAAKIQFLL